jgi:hypothetical protein
MEAHAGRRPSVAAAGRTRSIVTAGLVAGAVAGMMMAMYQMIVGAIAAEPTAVSGIDTSFWTPVTAITSVIFGLDAFTESFEFWPVIGGIAGHMMNSMVLGLVGVAAIAAAFWTRPGAVGWTMLGVMYGLVLEVVIVNLIVNQIQDVNTLYTSTPEWSWWVSHAIFGMTLGLVAYALLRRRSSAER